MVRANHPTMEQDLRMALWNNPRLIDQFIHEDPADFNQKDLDVVAGWRNFKSGDFILCKVVRGVGIFIPHDEPQDFYAVYALSTPFLMLWPEIPALVRTTLLPFEDVIVYDGSMAAYNIRFGPGFCKMASDWYINAKERGLIKNTIPDMPLTVDEQIHQREIANKSVKRYFKSYLKGKRLSEKIIERDLQTIEGFSTFLISTFAETTTLREITYEMLEAYLDSMQGEVARFTIVGLKRFFTYLEETERMEYELAEDILATLGSI